ncbi:dihydrofolate reductase family protein [uncultured Friedmanniella sp.]|uniref:dihydrofolate reductase family protein n=1 Tax=uncultured Friedmanniella sp. TaxID=335381 RepID=UPI0035CADD76
MTFTTSHMSISLDGFVAGPDQSRENPLGRGGLDLHRWHLPGDGSAHEVDQDWTDRLMRPRGAYIMGRNMFGPVRGDWSTDPDWQGWWGDEPPYHAPVFVLTHYAHDPVPMAGGTTFFFVTDGIAAALAQAREAGDGDVDISGGASAVRQVMSAGELDELSLDIAPVLLGRGERLFDGITGLHLDVLEAAHSPLATHVRYGVSRTRA